MLLKTYYQLKPLIPRRAQLAARRARIRIKRSSHAGLWPINEQALRQITPFPGWPDGKQFGLILTHDVESEAGRDHSLDLAMLETKLGFRSSFNFVCRKYDTPFTLRNRLELDGFEVGVHGVFHDGKLFSSFEEFEHRARTINLVMKSWDACGFRAPAMHSNMEWLKMLDIDYDLSSFDTDPFEPQPQAAGTVFPFYVQRKDGSHFIEMPYTLPQDFTLFILMREKTISIWKEKLAWIAQHGGMALINTHPDYMHFPGERGHYEKYPVELYMDLLEHIEKEYKGRYWHGLPADLANRMLQHQPVESI